MAEARKRRPWWKRLLWGAGLLGLAFVLGSSALVLLLRWIDPPVTAVRVQRRVASWSEPGPYAAKATWKDLEDISPSMGLAVIAAEDQNFPEHSGFDWKAIEKAIDHNEKSRRKRGASTVSQQTAKNLFCWSSRSWIRKGTEAWFTLLMEACWSKRRILEVYLNIVEFGDGIYGVEAASQAYFRKPAKRLSPPECALLAAVLPNPHKFKAGAPSAYILGRQAWILKQMQQLGGEAVVKELGK